MNSVTVHTDGASRGNPGLASIAYIIDGAQIEPIRYKEAIGLFSNNQAEYRALTAALDKLINLDLRDRPIGFFADSELMIKQIKGEYRVKDANLKVIFQQVIEKCATLRSKGNSLSFTAIPRSSNSQADRLANLALDSQ